VCGIYVDMTALFWNDDSAEAQSDNHLKNTIHQSLQLNCYTYLAKSHAAIYTS
jgi:hypothetical protein